MSTRASSVDHRKRIKKYRLFGAIVLLFLTYTPALFAADAILTWNRNAETTVTGYKIYYGTAPKQYTNSIDAGNQITYTVTSLSNLTYYFAVTAYDALKNESNYSNEASKAFTGTADTIPPLISGISVGSITSGGARITWSTDEPSSTQVEYGVITAYGSTAPLDATLTTAHGQTLTALLPGMRYHYRVLSRDAAGNLAVSPDGAFTTAMVPDTAAPAAPANLTAMPTASTQIDLAWSDSTDNSGVAGYRIYRNGVQVGTSGLPGYSDKELAPSTLYTYTVSAYDAAGNVSNQSIAASATTLLPGTTTTVVLRPLADTFLNLDRLVYHTEQTLNTYTWPNHQVANAILMKFDLTGIPKGAIVQSATLNLALVQSDASADAGYTVTAHKVINQNPDLTRATGSSYDGVNNWTASTCCYNQTPLAQADLSLPYATTGVDKVLGFKTWTITAMINEWVNQGVLNRGLLLNSDTTKLADRFRTFASMEHTDAALRPYLSVTYQLPNTPDTMAPVAQWVGPLSGSMVRGSVSVQANLSDNISVVQAAFFVDGAQKALQQGTDLKSVSWSWDTTGLTDGTHRLFVQAFDAAHLTGNSQEISVTVDNTPPTAPGIPSTTAILQNQISLTWSPSTDGISLMGYGIFRDGAALATTQGASFTDSGLAPNRNYSYAIVAVDAARNRSETSAAFSVKTLPLAPVVGIPTASTLTSNSATLSGSVDPSGASTSAWFEYGTTTTYGTVTAPVTFTASTTLSTPVTSLSAGTLHHVRLVAQNAGGKSYGPDQALTTLPDVLPPPVAGYTLTSEAYHWVVASDPLALVGDDNFKAISLPFPFPFYGQIYNEVYVSTNGLLTFGAGSYVYVPQPIPSSGGPNAYIAPFWRDLYAGTRQISYASSELEVVVSYTGVRNVCCSLPVFTFEVILRADGTIIIQYDTISSPPNTTVGIESPDGTEGIILPAIASGQTYRFTPIRP